MDKDFFSDNSMSDEGDESIGSEQQQQQTLRYWIYRYDFKTDAGKCSIYAMYENDVVSVCLDLKPIESLFPITIYDYARFKQRFLLNNEQLIEKIQPFNENQIYTVLDDRDPHELIHGNRKKGLAVLVQLKDRSTRQIILNHLIQNSNYYGCSPWIARKNGRDVLHYLIGNQTNYLGSYGSLELTINNPLRPLSVTATTLCDPFQFISCIVAAYPDEYPPSIPIASYDIEVVSRYSNEFPQAVYSGDMVNIISVAYCYWNMKDSENIQSIQTYTGIVVNDSSDKIRDLNRSNQNFEDIDEDGYSTRRYYFDNEANLLRWFLKAIRPAIYITGWFISKFDAAYLTQRMLFHFGSTWYEQFAKRCNFGYTNSRMRFAYQSEQRVIHLLIHKHQDQIDGRFLKEKFLGHLKTNNKLNNVAQAMGLGTKVDIGMDQMLRSFQHYYNRAENDESIDIDEYLRYCEQDAILALKIFYTQVKVMFNIMFWGHENIEDVIQTNGRVGFLESCIHFEAFKQHKPIPYSYVVRGSSESRFSQILNYGGKAINSGEKKKYKGALVTLPSDGGLYLGKIISVDVKSMYPSLMLTFNLTDQSIYTVPNTIEHPKWCQQLFTEHFHQTELETHDHVYSVRRQIDAMKTSPIHIFLNRTLEARNHLKREAKRTDISTELKLIYKGQEKTYKIAANALYGSLGQNRRALSTDDLHLSITQNLPAAAAITTRGRETLQNLMNHIEPDEVVYSDTDGIFINIKQSKIFERSNEEIIKYYLDKLNVLLSKGVELDCDGLGELFLIRQKKRYIFLQNGQLTLKGLKKIDNTMKELLTSFVYKILDAIIKKYGKSSGSVHLKTIEGSSELSIRRYFLQLLDTLVTNSMFDFNLARSFSNMKPLMEYKNPNYLQIQSAYQYLQLKTNDSQQNEIEYVGVFNELAPTNNSGLIMINEYYNELSKDTQIPINICKLFSQVAHIEDLTLFIFRKRIQSILLPLQRKQIKIHVDQIELQLGEIFAQYDCIYVDLLADVSISEIEVNSFYELIRKKKVIVKSDIFLEWTSMSDFLLDQNLIKIPAQDLVFDTKLWVYQSWQEAKRHQSVPMLQLQYGTEDRHILFDTLYRLAAANAIILIRNIDAVPINYHILVIIMKLTLKSGYVPSENLYNIFAQNAKVLVKTPLGYSLCLNGHLQHHWQYSQSCVKNLPAALSNVKFD